MAVSGSGLFVPTFKNALGASQLALDLDADTHKVALFSNSVTPNYDTDTAYAAFTTAAKQPTQLYTVNLSTGAVAAGGNIGKKRTETLDIAVAPVGVNFVADPRRAETAIRAGDDALASDHVRKADDALRD